MPAATKHDAQLKRLPLAMKAIEVVRAAGHPQMAEELKLSLEYAKEQAEQGVAKNARDGALGSRSVRVTAAFREHVHTALDEDGATVAGVVERNFHEFLDGSWTPARPTRAPRGSSVPKKPLNMRLKDPSLWERVNDLGSEPAAVAERGYKLTAEAVARAALEETFGLPESEQADTTA